MTTVTIANSQLQSRNYGDMMRNTPFFPRRPFFAAI
jgi:hypothetical protein